MKRIVLPAVLGEQILREARAAHPRECCGLLEGCGARIAAVHPMRNLAAAPDRFEIDPAGQFRLMRAGAKIVGCYHSHPNGAARPSPRDAAQAGEIGFLWLIAADTLGAFAWDGVGFEPVVLVPEPQPLP
jgi:proteasome lid subunit RPN8/RPN11